MTRKNNEQFNNMYIEKYFIIQIILYNNKLIDENLIIAMAMATLIIKTR